MCFCCAVGKGKGRRLDGERAVPGAAKAPPAPGPVLVHTLT